MCFHRVVFIIEMLFFYASLFAWRINSNFEFPVLFFVLFLFFVVFFAVGFFFSCFV